MNLDSKYAGFHEIKINVESKIRYTSITEIPRYRREKPSPSFFGELVLLLTPVGNNLGNPVERSVFVAARALGTTYDYVQNMADCVIFT